MTYREIAETIQRNLAGGDVSQDFPIELEEIYIRINQLIPFLIRKDFYETYKIEAGSSLNTNQYTSFIAKVQIDDETKEKYIILPSAPIVVGGIGLPELSYIQDRVSPIIYIEHSQYRALQSLNLSSEIQGGLVMYEKSETCNGTEERLILFNFDNCIEKLRVRMMLIGNIEDIDENAQVPIAEPLIELLIQALRQWYYPQDKEVQDYSNNGRNDNI
ncbi:MAG TPA: hypothetical protein PKG56_00275 [Chitinophagaceae bacterium]|nr:hypothetical protein [Chitinophagales bacterium]HNL81798.1 hypothetical protein [Chitinophagaceae bacterium]